MDGGAEPERAVARPEGPEGERREKRQSRHEGVCVGRWESANRADVSNMPPVNSPHFARYALLKLMLEQGTVRQFLSHGRECQTPQRRQTARREQQPDAAEQESQPDPPIPERADKTPSAQRFPDVPPYFLHSISSPTKRYSSVTCSRKAADRDSINTKVFGDGGDGVWGRGEGPSEERAFLPFPNLKRIPAAPGVLVSIQTITLSEFAGFFQILTGPFRLTQQKRTSPRLMYAPARSGMKATARV